MDDDAGGLVDPEILEVDGKQFAYQAVEQDKIGNYPTAVFYYNVSVLLYELGLLLVTHIYLTLMISTCIQ